MVEIVSRHAANATAAAVNHAVWFGESSDSANAVKYRATTNCEWLPIDGAVVHGEETKWVRKGNPQVSQQVIQRNVYSPVEVPLNSQIQIGGCDYQYTVVATLRRGGRFGLTCQRANTQEITRPNYRREMGGQ